MFTIVVYVLLDWLDLVGFNSYMAACWVVLLLLGCVLMGLLFIVSGWWFSAFVFAVA